MQGVGFRPFICRIAARHNLFGEVDNRSDGVSVRVLGDIRTVELFSNDILKNAPPASRIKSIEVNPIECIQYDNFKIAESRGIENAITEISPDIAVCSECLDDMQKDPKRIDYPFVNCTNCGPRFSIIYDLPYDRPGTSMESFQMCEKCRSEYNDILDRRFHAQPIACNNCGPVCRYRSKSCQVDNLPGILEKIAEGISSGQTIAIKGIGGYHLVCDALDGDAVSNMRIKKHRDSKPFAVMFRDLRTVHKYCHVSREEENELKSWRRPVLILRQKEFIPPSVKSGLNTIGALLPYMPVHYLLFRHIKTSAIIFTSGNISDEPVITDDTIAEKLLASVASAIVSYNRQIVNRVDDSVIRFIDKKPAVIRRSRGFVPRPVDLDASVEGIMAFGAEEKNTFCVGKGSQAFMSQYIGDLKNYSTFGFFVDSINTFSRLFRFRPALLACDMNPEYLSARYARSLAEDLNLPLVRIQHHHAHIVSCMAEHRLSNEVIGVCFDGTGYGSDGNIWGGEFLIAGESGFSRFSHFDYIPLPGGDSAMAEPWRTAYSFIRKYMGKDFDFHSLPSFSTVESSTLDMVGQMIDKQVNSPLSSGAGRLFDAVAAILGVCMFSTFDSEAPVRLESIINPETEEYYPFAGNNEIIFADTIRAIINDIGKVRIPVISAKFHNTVAQSVLETVIRIRSVSSLNRVVLSGGVFQNKYLMEKTLYLLNKNRFRVYINRQVPANDGGISLGQLVIASKMGESCV